MANGEGHRRRGGLREQTIGVATQYRVMGESTVDKEKHDGNPVYVHDCSGGAKTALKYSHRGVPGQETHEAIPFCPSCETEPA